MSEVPLYLCAMEGAFVQYMCPSCDVGADQRAPQLRLPEGKGPYLPDTVEPIATLEALPPRGGPVQDPVLTVWG